MDAAKLCPHPCRLVKASMLITGTADVPGTAPGFDPEMLELASQCEARDIAADIESLGASRRKGGPKSRL
jgi:hypothetical protein